MAVPETFRFVLVAIVAMIAYRFVTEISANFSDPSSPGAARKDSDVPPSLKAEMDPEDSKADAGSKNMAVNGDLKQYQVNTRRHKLRPNEVLIEYCTS